MLLTKLKIATVVVLMLSVTTWSVGALLTPAEALAPGTPFRQANIRHDDKVPADQPDDNAAKAKKEPKVLTPEQAIKQEPKDKVTVEFKVKTATMQPNPAFVPQGEEVDYIELKYSDKFYVHLYGKPVTTLKRLGIDPGVFFRDKVIRVTGEVALGRDPDFYGMMIESLDQLEVVK
jgi:hypothetical protein